MTTLSATDWFITKFTAFEGNPPFPWQTSLFERFIAGNVPTSCDIPTGLGKTKVILIWWLARQYSLIATTAHITMRLVYLVNRRTIVDQATIEAEKIAKQYPDELCVSTIRGQRADNENWKNNPDKPAIIVGTPDMIGSKLLFGGYGDGKYLRPIHAGIIGNDALYIVDEAHLSEPLCHTLQTVKRFQNSAQPGFGIVPIRIIELTATPTVISDSVFTLTQNDYDNQIVYERLHSVKMAKFHQVQSGEKPTCDAICKEADTHAKAKAKVLIYVYSPDFARRIRDTLVKKHGDKRVALLTGTLRGWERDQLVSENKVILSFMNGDHVDDTIYLISTSAGEVGWDIDADHLICDLTTLDSMIQRLGRVNRKGLHQNSTVCIVYSASSTKNSSPFRDSCDATRDLITEAWDKKSLSPDFLKTWVKGLSPADYAAAKSPLATPIQLHSYIIDAWTLTSVQTALPIKQPLADFIHGKNDTEPEAYLAWRSELGFIQESNLPLDKWLKICRLQPQELLRGRASSLKQELECLSKHHGDTNVVLIDSEYQAKFIPLKNLRNIANCVIILPTSVGGLRHGLLDACDATPVEDVADMNAEQQRLTVLVRRTDETCEIDVRPFGAPQNSSPQKLAKSLGMSLREIAFEDGSGRSLAVLMKRDGTTPITVNDNQPTVAAHNQKMADEIGKLATSLGFSRKAVKTMEWAGNLHDIGKADRLWQQAIYNFDGEPYAKSGPLGMNVSILGDRSNGFYRHEYGSLVQALKLVPPEEVDVELALYLISSHHGYARPHFQPGAAGVNFDLTAALAVPQRFASLQSHFGRWGLAWLHAIFCLADQRAS